MSIIDKLFNRSKAPIPNRNLYYSGLTPPDRTGEGFLNAYSTIGWLHAVVFRIALGCSEVEWTLFDTTNQDKPKQIFKHPLLTLLKQVNPFQTSNEFIALDTIYNELIGESFWALNFNALGEPAEIILPYPNKMSVVPDKNFPFVKGYVYGTGQDAVPFDVNEIIHFKYPNPLNQYRGLAPARAIGINLDAEQNADKWVNQFFYNSARPDGVIQFDYNLSDEQFEKLKKQWTEKYKGVSKAHQVALLEGGGKYIQIQNTIKDMDFANLKQKNRDVILGVWGMPLSVMGISENVNKANCYDSQTEYLTDNGWKLYEQVTDDDKIASYDNDYIKFEKPLKRYQYDYNGEMYHYTSKVTDLMVTPNHNLYYRTTEGEYRKTEAKDANYTRLIFKASCNWQGEDKLDIPFDIKLEDWLEFLGYFISEGGLSVKARNGHHYMFTLAQKNETHATKIRNCLSQLPFKFTEYQRDGCEDYFRWNIYGKEIHQYLLNTIGGYCEEKQIPKDVKSLNPTLLRILFDALMLGDGSWDKRDDRTSGYYATVSKQLADDVMEIALKLGYRVSCKPHTDKRPNRQVVYFVHLSELKEVEVQQSNDGINIEQYNGKVSCFEVSSHLLITRRNGFVSIQGNSEAGDYTFARWIVKPRLDWKKAKIQEQLIPKFRRSENLQIGFKEVVPETTEQKISAAESGMRAGYLTINEARKTQGLDPIPTGDVLLVPLNLIPTPIKGEMIKPPEETPEEEQIAESWSGAVVARQPHKLEVGSSNLPSATKSLTPDQKRLHWEAYAKKTERQEEVFKKVFENVFNEQKDLVIAEIERTGQLPPLDDDLTARKFEPAIELVYHDAFESAV